MDNIDFTTVRAHHDAAGMHLGETVLSALEEVVAEAGQVTSIGTASENRAGRHDGSGRCRSVAGCSPVSQWLTVVVSGR